MAKLRHWKQQFDPNARLMFRKSLNFGTEQVMPGDEVTEELKSALGKHRLKIWWRAGVIELMDFGKKSSLKHCGGGWYDVTLPDGSTDRVHGRIGAQLLIDSYND